MKIIQLRKAKGITQAVLADLCGTTQQQIARIENGVVDPRLSTLRRIADALHCELPELFLTREEFVRAVQETLTKHELDLRGGSLLELNSLTAREKFIPSFHPFWEKVVIKGSKIRLT